jgi:hypothetical protein
MQLKCATKLPILSPRRMPQKLLPYCTVSGRTNPYRKGSLLVLAMAADEQVLNERVAAGCYFLPKVKKMRAYQALRLRF